MQKGKEIEEAVTGDQWPATLRLRSGQAGEEPESGLYWKGTRRGGQGGKREELRGVSCRILPQRNRTPK